MAQSTVIPFGRVGEYTPKHPERTAYRLQPGLAGDVVFRTWPSRGAMLQTIAMQSKREPRETDWKDYFSSRWHTHRRAPRNDQTHRRETGDGAERR